MLWAHVCRGTRSSLEAIVEIRGFAIS